MTNALQTTTPQATTSEILLANRELLSLRKATLYLGARMRIRTPLGAVDYLEAVRSGAREAFDQRVEVAVDVMDLYRELFPREYRASSSPSFSVQREQEFYRLVNANLFPLDLDGIDDDPRFYLPFIPFRGMQDHNWVEGCCPFEYLDLVFQLVLVLSGRCPEMWRALGIARPPADPLDPERWTHFVYSCAVDTSLIRYLPHAFALVSYRTGNTWLDLPPIGAMFGFEWSRERLGQLFQMRRQAEAVILNVLALSRWLEQDRKTRVNRVIEMWQASAAWKASQ